MLFLIIFLSILISGIYFFRYYFSLRLNSLEVQLGRIKEEAKELDAKLEQLKTNNRLIEESFKKQTALYEMTKLISQTLDKKQTFSIFKNNILRFIECKDCKFLPQASPEELTFKEKDTVCFPLKMQEQLLGNVIFKGLEASSKDTAAILVNQLNLVFRKITLFEEIQRLSITDSLTGVFNHRYLIERFEQEFKRATRYKLDLSIMMIDIDLFKQCNDKYGHFVGDVVLREVANIIKGNIRNIDFLGRYGGEEFLVILPSTSKEKASAVSQRILIEAAKHTIKAYDELVKVTLSLGIASFPDDTAKIPVCRQARQDLLDKSDFALYRAKRTGRNRVCIYGVYK